MVIMEGGLAVLLVFTAFYVPCRGIMTVPMWPPTEGGTLQIRCSETDPGADLELSGIELSKVTADTSGSTYSPIVSYSYSRTAQSFVVLWTNTNYKARGNATSTLSTAANAGDVVFTLPDVRCSDSAEFACRRFVSPGNLIYESGKNNITIQGITQYPTIDGAFACDTVTVDPDCERCVPFDDSPEQQPKYATMNQEVVLRCTAGVAKPVSQSSFKWYKKVKVTNNSPMEQPIIENVTNAVPVGGDSAGSCTSRMSSTLRYYPGEDDRDLRIICRITSTASSVQSVEGNMSICVSGLIPVVGNPVNPGDPGPSSAGLGGGPIAGIVIGVIAVIVLVAVLVYFLWYKRRDSGESYNTREPEGRNAPPPVSKKPEMHENTMYDNTGDGHQQDNYPNNRYAPGKVNYSMDNDYYREDNDTAPRSRDPIGSSV